MALSDALAHRNDTQFIMVDFVRGDTRLRYVKSNYDVDLDGAGSDPSALYVNKNLDVENITHNEDFSDEATTVRLNRDDEVSEWYIQEPPAQRVTVHIYKYSMREQAKYSIFSGVISGVRWDTSYAYFSLEPIIAYASRRVNNRVVSKNCRHVLYKTDCGVTLSDHTGSALVTGTSPYSGVDGTNLSLQDIVIPSTFMNIGVAATQIPVTIPIGVTGYAKDLTGGAVWFDDGSGILEVQTIENNWTHGINIRRKFNSDIIGQTVYFAVGCPHTFETCKGRFANGANYGGFPWLPSKNIFTINLGT